MARESGRSSGTFLNAHLNSLGKKRKGSPVLEQLLHAPSIPPGQVDDPKTVSMRSFNSKILRDRRVNISMVIPCSSSSVFLGFSCETGPNALYPFLNFFFFNSFFLGRLFLLGEIAGADWGWNYHMQKDFELNKDHTNAQEDSWGGSSSGPHLWKLFLAFFLFIM